MNAYELRKQLQAILDAISIDHAITKYIFILARGYEEISSELTELLYTKNRTLFSKKQQSSQDKFYELRKHSEKFPLGQIFHEAIQLQNTLKELEGVFEDIQDKSIREIRFQVERFYKAFETFARNNTDQTFTVLLTEASQLYTILSAARKAFTTLAQALLPDPGEDQQKGRIELLFDGVHDIGTVNDKLKVLQRVYNEICDLSEISADRYPLETIKIEVPSLWGVFEGERRAIGILAGVIERFALFMYSRFGAGEESGPVSERVVASQSLINLTDELDRHGFKDVVQDTLRMQRSALILRRDLVLMLAGQPSVTVNEKPLAVEEASTSIYIIKSLQLLKSKASPPSSQAA